MALMMMRFSVSKSNREINVLASYQNQGSRAVVHRTLKFMDMSQNTYLKQLEFKDLQQSMFSTLLQALPYLSLLSSPIYTFTLLDKLWRALCLGSQLCFKPCCHIFKYSAYLPIHLHISLMCVFKTLWQELCLTADHYKARPSLNITNCWS